MGRLVALRKPAVHDFEQLTDRDTRARSEAQRHASLPRKRERNEENAFGLRDIGSFLGLRRWRGGGLSEPSLSASVSSFTTIDHRGRVQNDPLRRDLGGRLPDQLSGNDRFDRGVGWLADHVCCF